MLGPHVRARGVQSSVREPYFSLRSGARFDDGELGTIMGPGVSVWRAVAQEAVGVAAAAGRWFGGERRLLGLCEVLLLRLTAFGVRVCVRRFATVRAT